MLMQPRVRVILLYHRYYDIHCTKIRAFPLKKKENMKAESLLHNCNSVFALNHPAQLALNCPSTPNACGEWPKSASRVATVARRARLRLRRSASHASAARRTGHQSQGFVNACHGKCHWELVAVGSIASIMERDNLGATYPTSNSVFHVRSKCV